MRDVTWLAEGELISFHGFCSNPNRKLPKQMHSIIFFRAMLGYIIILSMSGIQMVKDFLFFMKRNPSPLW